MIVVRKRAGRSEDRLEIRIVEILSDVEPRLDEGAGLEKDGVERDLQEALAAHPEAVDDGLRLVRREWPTDIGPVDLMCRDEDDGWVAVEIKRIGTIDAVEQLGALPRADPPRPGDGRMSWHPGGAERQEAGANAGRGARHGLGRGRPRARFAASASPS